MTSTKLQTNSKDGMIKTATQTKPYGIAIAACVTLKGRNMPAQGNALGIEYINPT